MSTKLYGMVTEILPNCQAYVNIFYRETDLIKIEALSAQIAVLDTQLNNLNTTIDNLKSDINIVKNEIEVLSSNLTSAVNNEDEESIIDIGEYTEQLTNKQNELQTIFNSLQEKIKIYIYTFTIKNNKQLELNKLLDEKAFKERDIKCYYSIFEFIKAGDIVEVITVVRTTEEKYEEVYNIRKVNQVDTSVKIAEKTTAMTPAQTFLNYAMMAGKERFFPRFRYGKITKINEDNTVDVEVEELLIGHQKIDANEYTELYNIPLTNYFQAIFGVVDEETLKVGDDVIIEFLDCTWEGAKRIIGYKYEPRAPKLPNYFIILPYFTFKSFASIMLDKRHAGDMFVMARFEQYSTTLGYVGHSGIYKDIYDYFYTTDVYGKSIRFNVRHWAGVQFGGITSIYGIMHDVIQQNNQNIFSINMNSFIVEDNYSRNVLIADYLKRWNILSNDTQTVSSDARLITECNRSTGKTGFFSITSEIDKVQMGYSTSTKTDVAYSVTGNIADVILQMDKNKFLVVFLPFAIKQYAKADSAPDAVYFTTTGNINVNATKMFYYDNKLVHKYSFNDNIVINDSGYQRDYGAYLTIHGNSIWFPEEYYESLGTTEKIFVSGWYDPEDRFIWSYQSASRIRGWINFSITPTIDDFVKLFSAFKYTEPNTTYESMRELFKTASMTLPYIDLNKLHIYSECIINGNSSCDTTARFFVTSDTIPTTYNYVTESSGLSGTLKLESYTWFSSGFDANVIENYFTT